jgi:DDE superfamily endonuclease
VAHIILSGLLAAWVGTLAEHLHGRNAWRLSRLIVGVILAQGRRTVTSWFRAAGITRGYRSSYYFLAALGLKVQAIGLSVLDLTIQRVPIGDRLTLALDDTPTKRHGPKIEAAGRHHNPTPGPSGSRTLYGHNWVVLARLVKHAHSHIIGLPLWASLYVRRCDVPSLPRDVTPWEFQTKLELGATMIQATADSLKGRWDGPVWLLTDGGYAKRPIHAAARQAGWVTVTRLQRDAHLNDLPPVLKPGQRRGRGRPRVYGTNRIRPETSVM